MNNFRLYLKWLSALSLIAGGFSGCQKEPVDNEGPGTEPEVEISLEVSSAGLDKISFSIDATEGAEAAYLFATTEEIGGSKMTAENIFVLGSSVDAETFPATVDITGDIAPNIEYTILAAARKGDKYSEVATATAIVEKTGILSFTDATKTSFTYRISNTGNRTYFHTYFEKWFFEYIKEYYESYAGEPLSVQETCELALMDFGKQETGDKEITWNAGDPNDLRGEGACANITPGKEYMAVAAIYDPSTQKFDTAEIVEFSTPEAGKSQATVSVEIEDLTEYGMLSVITPDENVRFYYYSAFLKEEFDRVVESEGEEFFEDYLFIYGDACYNEYTTKWSFTNPGVPYVLSVYGIDINGDTFLYNEVVTPPAIVPEISINLQPFDSETASGFNTLKMEAGFANFENPIIPGNIYFAGPFTTESIGMGIEDCMNSLDGLVNTILLPVSMYHPDWLEQISSTGGDFEAILDTDMFFSPLSADKTYYTIVALVDSEGKVQYASYGEGRTAKTPSDADDPDYSAYIGNWTLKGQSTGDNWGERVSYDLRIEENVKNHSFKVYGWSGTSASQEHPFIMNYDPETKGIYVKGPQNFGDMPDDPESDLVFGGMILYGVTDHLTFCYDSYGTIFTGKRQDDMLSIFGEVIEVDLMPYEYMTMNYVSIKKDFSGVSRLEGATEDIIYFNISRNNSQSSAAMSGTVSASGVSGSSVIPDRNFVPMRIYGTSANAPANGIPVHTTSRIIL